MHLGLVVGVLVRVDRLLARQRVLLAVVEVARGRDVRELGAVAARLDRHVPRAVLARVGEHRRDLEPQRVRVGVRVVARARARAEHVRLLGAERVVDADALVASANAFGVVAVQEVEQQQVERARERRAHEERERDVRGVQVVVRVARAHAALSRRSTARGRERAEAPGASARALGTST